MKPNAVNNDMIMPDLMDCDFEIDWLFWDVIIILNISKPLLE